MVYFLFPFFYIVRRNPGNGIGSLFSKQILIIPFHFLQLSLLFFFPFSISFFSKKSSLLEILLHGHLEKKKKEILLHIYLMNVSFSFFIIHYFMGWIDLFRCCKSDALIYFTTIKKINDALKMREEMTEILFRNSGKCGIWRNYLNHKW